MEDRNMQENLVYRKNISKCSKDEGFKSKQYENTAVEGFGMALLKKMGLQKDLKIGKTNAKRVEVKTVSRRSDRVGLGSGTELAKRTKTILKKSNISEKPKKYETKAKIDSDDGLDKPHITVKPVESKKIEWAVPNLIVVIIGNEFRPSRFLNKLAIIVDCIAVDNIMLKIIENSRDDFYAKNTLINVTSESSIKPYVGDKGSRVVFIKGPHRLEKGVLLEKGHIKCEAIVQLADDMNIVQCNLNDISSCE